MTVFHWVRHGPTHAKNFVGWRDLPADLSNTDQIARLTAHLPQDAVVVSSDLLRSVQTANAICADRPRLLHQPMLREFNFGAWDGLHFETVAERYPLDSRAYWEQPGDIAPPGGESWNAAAHRINVASDQLGRKYSDRPIVVVAHIGVILTQVQRTLGITAYEALSHKIDNLSVTEIDLRNDTPQVVRINHCP
ncbi:MAG: histidine phosphatase family protein [Aliishimia sp.]